MNQPPPIILLNTIDSELADRYEPQKVLAEYFKLPIETIHQALCYFEVRCFAQAGVRDKLCESTTQIENDLLQIERDYGITLAELAQTSRIIILIENFCGQPHIEFAMALSLFVAAMSKSWPDVVGVHFDPKNSYEFQITEEVQLRATLTEYSARENRQIIYPGHQTKK